MGIEENKALVQRFFDEVNSHRLDKAAEFFAPDYIDHYGSADTPPTRGSATFKQLYGGLLKAFPDLHQTLEDQVAEGDKVVSRKTYRGTHRGQFMGIAPTGKAIAVLAIDIFRIANGKLEEHWGLGDLLGAVQQLGAAPGPGR